MAASKKTSNTPPPVHVGDRVRFQWGFRDVDGVVVEDRGPLGVGGRRLYDIAFRLEFDDEDRIAPLAASQFVVVKPASKATDQTGTAR
jgi:hypothetical protein